MIALSGGPDSSALLVLAAMARPTDTLLACTFDHALRPDSAAEADGARRLADSLGVRHVTRRWERAAELTTGIQERARHARYDVVTAHQAEDQAETILMRLFRGSGLDGLAGIAPVTTPLPGLSLVRPLLDVGRAELAAVLAERGVTAVNDPSNRDTTFLRPRLRALMPALAREGFDTRAILAFGRHMARANTAIEQAAGDLVAALGEDPRRGLGRFHAAPMEVRVRALERVIERRGQVQRRPSDAELERLARALLEPGAKRTLGALVFEASEREGLRISVAPPRR